jgi:hypothetical protein
VANKHLRESRSIKGRKYGLGKSHRADIIKLIIKVNDVLKCPFHIFGSIRGNFPLKALALIIISST